MMSILKNALISTFTLAAAVGLYQYIGTENHSILKICNDNEINRRIYLDKNKRHVGIQSMGQYFNIDYVKHAAYDPGINFPAINMMTDAQHNAWLHIVTTDAEKSPQWLHFIDSCSSIYPFYTLGDNFHDCPCWGWPSGSKPLNFWVGHAYAVSVDHEKKTIKCVGGISWGFKSAWWSIKPVMILPAALIKSDWLNDWLIFQKELPGYVNI